MLRGINLGNKYKCNNISLLDIVVMCSKRLYDGGEYRREASTYDIRLKKIRMQIE